MFSRDLGGGPDQRDDEAHPPRAVPTVCWLGQDVSGHVSARPNASGHVSAALDVSSHVAARPDVTAFRTILDNTRRRPLLATAAPVPASAGASALLAVASPPAAMLRHAHLVHVAAPHAHNAPHREHCRAHGHDRHHGLHEAHVRIPSPDVLHAPFVQFGLAGVVPGRHDGAVDQSAGTRPRRATNCEAGQWPSSARPCWCAQPAESRVIWSLKDRRSKSCPRLSAPGTAVRHYGRSPQR